MPSNRGGSVDAVTIDAFGTLVELENPVGRLQAALAKRGLERDAKSVAAAFASEVDYYLVHKGEGRDDATLLDLRNRCAGVFLEGVAPELDAEEFAPAFVAALGEGSLEPADGVLELDERAERVDRDPVDARGATERHPGGAPGRSPRAPGRPGGQRD